MVTAREIVNRYLCADIESRVDIVCRYYTQIDQIVDARISSITYLIIDERHRARQAAHEELGVRIQSGGEYSDPTADEAVTHADLESEIREGYISDRYLEDIPRPEMIMLEVNAFLEMKKIRSLCDVEIRSLIGEDRELFSQYMTREMTITDIALRCQIEYPSAVKKMSRIKKIVQHGVIESLKDTSGTSCHVGTKEGKNEY